MPTASWSREGHASLRAEFSSRWEIVQSVLSYLKNLTPAGGPVDLSQRHSALSSVTGQQRAVVDRSKWEHAEILRCRSPITPDFMATLVRFSSPAGKVLAQLRDGPKTVEEIARALRLTPNAVRNQLRKLEGWKLAARTGSRPTASKPFALYSITLDGEIQFSTVYLPVLSQFLRVAEGQCSGRQLGSWMRETGRTLGRRYAHPEGTRKERVEAAADLLRSFGGLADVRRSDGLLMIESPACPLAALTSEHPAACKILESLLAEYLEMSVKSCCITGMDPRCCFEVKA